LLVLQEQSEAILEVVKEDLSPMLIEKSSISRVHLLTRLLALCILSDALLRLDFFFFLIKDVVVVAYCWQTDRPLGVC